MGIIRLNRSSVQESTIISNHFIDHYMPQANGEFVKIYLYLLRVMQAGTPELSVASIADLMNHTEADIIRALRYWERQQLLVLETDPSGDPVGISLSAPVAAAGNTPVPSAGPAAAVGPSMLPQPEPAAYTPPKRKKYTADEVQQFSTVPELEELFFIIQTYLKKQLSSTDTNTVLYWYDVLGFSCELIEYLVEYCISKNHTSTRYMDKVAIGWAENGITTVEQARENAQAHSQIYYAVMKALGIHGRNLVPAETDFIAKWTKEYGFEKELITEACARTIAATHQPSFEYTDSILSSWYKNQVKQLSDIQKLDEAHNQAKKAPASSESKGKSANKFNNFNQRTYDMDQLEKMLLNAPID